MVQRYTPATKIKVVPKEGEIEISLDITINVNADGLVVASAETTQKETKKTSFLDDEEVKPIIPNFISGGTLNFGKEVKEEN